ncbi:MAG TPA: glycosyltransferase family 4 protein [Methylomirabilota bacterium]
MKVVHLAQDWRVGGLERVAATLVLGLRARQVEVEAWGLSGGGPVLESLAQAGVATRVFRHDVYLSPLAIASVARALRATGAAIVHTHALPAGVLGRLAALAAGAGRVHHWHTMPELRGWTALKERLLNACTDKIVCCADAVRRALVGGGWAKADRCSVVYNGVPAAEFDVSLRQRTSVRTRWGLADSRLAIGTIASLEPPKGHRVLLDGIPGVLARCPSAIFVWAGEGSQAAELRTEVAARGLEGAVRFLGLVDDVPAVLSALDLVVLPSTQREGFPLSLTEAAMAGCPAIASRLGGIPEVIEDRQTGLLVPPGDVAALTDAIVELLSSAELRRRFGEAARIRARARFTSEAMVDQVGAIYRAVLGPSRGRGPA